MTHRDRKLLDVSHDAPCFLLLGAPGCGNDRSVPCHSDTLEDGRGKDHKTHDALAVPGCPPCHAIFTREHLGRDGYVLAHARALKRYIVWLWETQRLALVTAPVVAPVALLTETQRRGLDFIRRYSKTEGISPTILEIAHGMQYRSQNAAAELVQQLVDKRAVTVKPGKARSIRVL